MQWPEKRMKKQVCPVGNSVGDVAPSGLRINPEDLKIMCCVHRQSTKGRTYLDFFLDPGSKWEGPVTNQEPNKCSELRFVARSDLDGMKLCPPIQLALELIDNGESFATFTEQQFENGEY